jgi:hypothetical protein
MIHQGSAVSGHYYIFIYNESQRKWRKYSDRFVTEVTAEYVQKISLGEANKSTNVTCLIYKANEFKCDPFSKPPISASLKNSTIKYDEFVAENINRVRIERMLRNCSDIATEEIEYFIDEFRQDSLICVSYFNDPMYYFIGNGRHKLAELLRVKLHILEPSFLAEANNNQLPPQQLIEMPNVPL